MTYTDLYIYIYISITLILGFKRFVPAIQNYFGNHPFGNWAMYSVPIEIINFSVSLKNIENDLSVDITDIVKRYLWHNFENGEFISLGHPDIPYKALEYFPIFLAKQEKIIAIKLEEFGENSKIHIILYFHCLINHKHQILNYYQNI